MNLRQRRLWDYREFTLLEKEILIKLKSPMEDIELKFKYEDLGFETAYVKKKLLSLILSIALAVTAIAGGLFLVQVKDSISTSGAWLIAGSVIVVITLVFLICYSDRKPQIVIKGGKESFSVLADSPSQEKVDEFIKILQDRIIERIIDIEVKPNNPHMDYASQKEALENLLDNEIISREKFEEVLLQLKEKQKTKPAIGF